MLACLGTCINWNLLRTSHYTLISSSHCWVCGVSDLCKSRHLSVNAPQTHSRQIPLTFFPSVVIRGWIHPHARASFPSPGQNPVYTHLEFKVGQPRKLFTITPIPITWGELKGHGKARLRGCYHFELRKMCIWEFIGSAGALLIHLLGQRSVK